MTVVREHPLTLPLGDPRHGTYNGYSNYDCRCDECRAANAAYQRRADARRAATGLPEGDPRHGENGYTNYGCRCSTCTEAKRVRNANRARRTAS